MGEVIRLEEIDRERRRSRARVAERAHLERAVALLRENLASCGRGVARRAGRAGADRVARTYRAVRGDDPLRPADAWRGARATGLTARLSQTTPSPDVRGRGQRD